MHIHTSHFLDEKHRHLIAVASLCAGIALFDFSLFVYFSDLLSGLFFNQAGNGEFYQVQLFALFAIGYFAKPIGGLLLGRYGDTQGRKPALRVGIFGMMIFTLLIAILPSYQHMGILATVLLLIARFGQGFMLGSVIPNAWVLTTEHLPSKNLGIGCGIISATCTLFALVLTGLVGFLENSLSSEQMLTYGWRILFIMGAIISFSAFLLSKNISETPIFTDPHTSDTQLNSYLDNISLKQQTRIPNTDNIKQTHTPTPSKIPPLLSKYQGFSITIAVMLAWIISSLTIVVPMLFTPLIAGNYITNDTLYFGNIISLLFMMFGAVFFGYLADKFNAGRILVAGGLFLIIQVTAFFYHLRHGGEMILVFFALLGFANGLIGALPPVIVRLFPAKIRMTGVGLSYNLVNALIGGILPFVLGYISFYFAFAPMLYLTGVGILAIFISFFIYYIPRSERDLIR